MSECFDRLVLTAWREFGRREELSGALEALLPALRELVPAERLLVWHLDRGRRELESWGHHGFGRRPSPLPIDPRVLDESFASCNVVRGDSSAVFAAAASSPERALAGVLRERGEITGVLVAFADEHATFLESHQTALRALLEPVETALVRAIRHRELADRREAAEADKRSLLVRLGRDPTSDEVIGAQRGLQAVMEHVMQVAGTDVPVLLLGETGSGKEVVARATHTSSRRASGPFVRVNCGAIPSELIDSELFGHERGSFTGASAMRRGWFERANGGTLFLDEIGELPPAAQVRLLRVLQDGTFERVGGQETRHADVRIIAATHRKLGAMIAQGQFRQDLWYRIAVFEVRIPPLRERLEDLPELVEHFVRRASHRFGLPLMAATAEDIAQLAAYRWPGNIRELAAVIDRAVLLASGGQLNVAAALGVGAGAVGTRPPPPASSAPPPPISREPAFPPMDNVMASHIKAALVRSRGRVDGPFGAARLLDVAAHTLRARMRKLGIDWRNYREAQIPEDGPSTMVLRRSGSEDGGRRTASRRASRRTTT